MREWRVANAGGVLQGSFEFSGEDIHGHGVEDAEAAPWAVEVHLKQAEPNRGRKEPSYFNGKQSPLAIDAENRDGQGRRGALSATPKVSQGSWPLA